MKQRTIILVWKTGGGYTLDDVRLLAFHIHKWSPNTEVLCLTDNPIYNFSSKLDIGVTFLRMKYEWEGWWSKLNLFSPELEKYRPFLYMDLDTAIVGGLDEIYPEEDDENRFFITLEDFYQHGKLASGLMWIPKKTEKLDRLWMEIMRRKGFGGIGRMDYFLREMIAPDLFFQHYTNSIYSFKPNGRHNFLLEIPEGGAVVCFHGRPRMKDIKGVEWFNQYIETA